MNAWIVLVLLGTTGLVSASTHELVQHLTPALEELESLPLALQKARSSVPLRVALRKPKDKRIDDVEEKILESLGKILREYAEKLLNRLEEAEAKASKTLDELRKDIHEEGLTSNKARLVIQQLTAIDEESDKIANQLNTALSSDLETSLSAFALSDWWEKIKQWFEGIGAAIPDKLSHFKEWAKDVFDKAIDGSKPVMDQIKAFAKEFLKNNWESLTKELVKEALEFFTPFKGELGDEIVDELIKLAKKFGLVPWEKN